MSEQTGAEFAQEAPIVNDAITSEDTGFVSDAGNQPIEEPTTEGTEQEGESEAQSSVESENVEDFQEEVEKAIQEGASEEEVAQMVKEFKLKVNGKEITKTIDLSDEDAIKRELQLAAAGQSAMQRSRELEKLYEQELNRLKNDPFSVLQELGLDPDELSEQHLRAKVEELKKSPEQLEREQMQRELEQARLQLKKAEEERQKAEYDQLVQQEGQKLENEIIQALDSHTTLPKSQKTVARIADAMFWAMENGYPDVTVNDVLPSVETEIRRELEGFMSDLPEDLLENYIGKRNLERLRKKRLTAAKQRTATANEIKPTISTKETNEQVEKKKLKARDYFKNL